MLRSLRRRVCQIDLATSPQTASFHCKTGVRAAESTAVATGSTKSRGNSDKGGKRRAGEEQQKAVSILDEILRPLTDSRVPRDPAELERDAAIAKDYSRRKMRELRLHQAAEATRFRMKQAAIAALPAGRLRDAAMQPDLTPFPQNRVAPALTPPLPALLDERDAERGAAPARKIR